MGPKAGMILSGLSAGMKGLQQSNLSSLLSKPSATSASTGVNPAQANLGNFGSKLNAPAIQGPALNPTMGMGQQPAMSGLGPQMPQLNKPNYFGGS